MILTPIDPDRLPALLELFDAMLDDAGARAVFRRIAVPAHAARAVGALAAVHHREALAVVASFGMGIEPGSPAAGFNWDGRAVRAGTEAYVLLHEVAHFQLASPIRRGMVDFGLGPGPETGEREAAERAIALPELTRDREEAMASLLGILWEVELGHPALASFLDQNWLEGVGRPASAAHFQTTLDCLREAGLVAAEGRPTRRLRQTADVPSF